MSRCIWYGTMKTDSISHVMRAALNPINLDERQVNAVAARIELDLRLGASFTRFQTLTLRAVGNVFEGKVVSYGWNSPWIDRTTLTTEKDPANFPR